jgi:hypothetical protein
MSEFTFLFRGRGEAPLPEERRETLQRWVAWISKLGENGHLKDPGGPLQFSGRVVAGPSKTVRDGPYAEAKDVVGGFMRIEARDIDEAVELSKGCPILDVGGTVEIRPIERPSFQ